MFNSPIKARIMKAINSRIADVEKQYTDGCTTIDTEAETKKTALADQLVESVIGKIL